MTIRLWPQLILVTLVVILTACGGGGGGGGGTNPPQQPAFSSALGFKTPSTFANGEAYVTQGSLVSITGGLNSSSTPSGFCPDTQPPQDYSVRWNNAANGDSGSTPIGIVCVTISGIPGIRSQFITDSILLDSRVRSGQH